MQSLFASLRLAAATIAVCVIGYTAAILVVAQTLVADSANGSLITDANGTVVGSRLIAQKFTDPSYFWPRPSAVDYNGAGAGGSNKSPTSDAVRERGEAEVARHGATSENPLPPELATASGGGLDPHISEHAARYQVARVAAARNRPPAELEALVDELAFAPGGPFTAERIVNVLELNLALQRLP
jgi:K+-transporting ATPase ATPase C chain